MLEKETFVLIDVGAHLYGYSSDICRTFFPPFFSKPESEAEILKLSSAIQKKQKVKERRHFFHGMMLIRGFIGLGYCV